MKSKHEFNEIFASNILKLIIIYVNTIQSSNIGGLFSKVAYDYIQVDLKILEYCYITYVLNTIIIFLAVLGKNAHIYGK